MTNTEDLQLRLNELRERLSRLIEGDQRPLDLHWSDVQMLAEASKTLQLQDLRVKNSANALTMAISMAGRVT